MYTAILVIQYIGIIAIILGLCYVFSNRSSKLNNLLEILLVASLVNEIGYTMELKCTTLETALIAIKFAYAGKLIMIITLFIFVMQFCDVKVPRWLNHTLIGIHCILYCLVWNCENNKLFYSSIDYTLDGLYPHVLLGHGIMYNVFMGLTFSYVVCMIVAFFVKYIKANNVDERRKISSMMLIPLFSVLGLVIYRTGMTGGYDTTSLAYVFCSVSILIVIRKFSIFDDKDVAKDVILDEFAEPVIVLDENKIIYYNEQFERLFPDFKLKDNNINPYVSEFCEKDFRFERNSKFYVVAEKNLIQNNMNMGKIFVFSDVTLDHADKIEHILKMQDRLIMSMADMVENRDSSTGGHIRRTSQVVEILIEEMKKDEQLNLDEQFCDAVIKAAPMHDLGKIAVDDSILRKQGKYEDWEYEQMKTHSEKGAEIVHKLLSVIDDRYFAQVAENVAHYHHERYDGSGYPCRLKGEEIPFEARIMAVADVYDALVSKRCYKDSMSFEKAFEIIESGMGTQFDESLNKYFLKCRGKLEEYYISLDQGE